MVAPAPEVKAWVKGVLLSLDHLTLRNCTLTAMSFCVSEALGTNLRSQFHRSGKRRAEEQSAEPAHNLFSVQNLKCIPSCWDRFGIYPWLKVRTHGVQWLQHCGQRLSRLTPNAGIA